MSSPEASIRRVDMIGLGRNLKKAVILGGVGNLGSKIAHVLAKQSFGTIKIIDCDVVEEANVGYQEYGVEDIGKYKVDALRNHLMNMYPWVKVESYIVYVLGPGSVLADEVAAEEQRRLLSDIFSKSDAVISTFDRGAPRITFTALAVIYDRPLVLVSAWSMKRRDDDEYYHNAQLMAWRPGMPCPLCYTRYSLSPLPGGGTYVAHPAISHVAAALAAFLVERLIYGGVEFVQTRLRMYEEGSLNVEYLSAEAVKTRCPLCSRREYYRKVLEGDGIMALAEVLDHDLRDWWER